MQVQSSLSAKIIILVAGSILLTAAAIVGFSVYTLRGNAMQAAQEEVLALADKEGFKIREQINHAVFTTSTMAQVFSKVLDPDSPLDIPRYEASNLIRSILEKNPSFMATFTCWEENSYDLLDAGYIDEEGHDATGRFAPLWRRDQDGKPFLRPLLADATHSPRGRPGPWYASPLETGAPYVSDPFIDGDSGKLLISITVPVTAPSSRPGVVGVDLSLREIREQIRNIRYFKGAAEIVVVTGSGIIVAASGRQDVAGRRFRETYVRDRDLLSAIESAKQQTAIQQGRLLLVSPISFGAVSNSSWALVFSVPVAALTADITLLMWKQAAICLAIMTVMIILAMLGMRKILTRPLGQLLQGIERVTQGNLGYQVEIAGYDEIGSIAENFNIMRRKLRKLINTLKSYQLELEKKVAQRTAALELSNSRIKNNRNKLQRALDEISTMIQIVVEKEGDLDAYFKHPELTRCWEALNCGEKECPCYGKEAQRCWHVENTRCAGIMPKNFTEKHEMCRRCRVYQNATSDPIYQIGEHFNNMIFILRKNREKLDQANRQLSQAQKMESVGRLAAGIAHEINTPIQYIGTNIDFLDEAFADVAGIIADLQALLTKAGEQQGLSDEVSRISANMDDLDWPFLAAELPKAISQSKDGLKRVSTIVQAMKEFSHPGTREKSANDLNKIINNTVTIAANEWKYVAEVDLKLDPELPPVACLSEEIGQVVLNMVVNAAHAIADKVDKEEGEKGRITIKTFHDEKWAAISITDTGGGIPEDALDKIFDPFFTTKEVGSGSGQGLAIAHDVITKHGGTIQVKSKAGEGTTFLVKLPLS